MPPAIAQASLSRADISELSQRTLLPGIGLVSFGALVLELALTRLFSVVLFYHFAFLAISIALLGLGAGGVAAYLGRPRLGRYSTRQLGAACSAANAVAIALVLVIVLQVPVSLELSWANFSRLTVIYLVSAVPFFLTGFLSSAVFSREHHRIPLLYAADLAGGALACLAIVPLLDMLGAPNTIFAAGVALAGASAVWSTGGKSRKRALMLGALLLLVIGLNSVWRIVDVIYAKGVRLSSIEKVEFVRWNAISRVEVDVKKDHSRWIVIDADANSALMNVAPHAWQGVWEDNLMAAPSAVVNLLRPHGRYAIIGPGGGVDVLRAVANGSADVVGIEINPIIANTIMRERYANYSYHLYELPNVHIVVSDGRSYIRGSHRHFNVIEMTLVDTWASTAAGAFALSENYLYTVQAFEQYFQHLRPGGIVAVTRWEFKQPREALRVVSVAMNALHHLGVADPAANFMVISDGPLDVDGRPVTVLAKKTAFTPAEEQIVLKSLDHHLKLVPLYLPSMHPDNAFSRLLARNNAYAFARSYPFNVAPVTDDSPFLFFTLKTRQVLKQAATLTKGIDWKVNLGVVILGLVLMISIAAVLAFLILPLVVHGGRSRVPTLPLVYFVAIGLGYMLVEITFVQRLVLFLGNPIYAITVVIFLLLVSSSVGSWVSHHWLGRFTQVRVALAAIIGVLIADVVLLSRMLSTLVGLPFLLKLIVSAILLVPLGFAMGMPFPTGLRQLTGKVRDRTGTAAASENTVEWAWAMNAGSSVMGSVLAMVIAVHLGLNVTLACGAAAYLAALMFTPAFRFGVPHA
jgi:spermidine synthase